MMLRDGHYADGTKPAVAPHDALAFADVRSHQRKLLWRVRAWLDDQLPGNGALADVVQQRAVREFLLLGGRTDARRMRQSRGEAKRRCNGAPCRSLGPSLDK